MPEGRELQMRKLKIIISGLTVVLLIGFSLYIFDRFSYSKELSYVTFSENEPDSVLTIGIIGDSWVAGKKLDSLLHSCLLSYGFSSTVISSGHPGAKSKLIYQNLFKTNDEHYSSRFVLESSPDYCIVVAGVNDAIGQVGGNFYSYHLRQIIKTLIDYKIKPVVVTLPQFDIERTIGDMKRIKKYRNYIFALFTNDGKINNIETFQNILSEDLQLESLTDSVVLVDFNEICSNYDECREYYANSSHLSIEGNRKLADLIASKLANEINASLSSY